MYVRFPLSLRNVEDLLFERGIDICHETVRHWWNRFGPMFAGDIRRQRVNAILDVGSAKSNTQDDPADAQIEVPPSPTTRLGDVWMLNKHRIICGSSLDPEVWRVLMNDKLAAMSFSDPPFNVKVGGARLRSRQGPAQGICHGLGRDDPRGVRDVPRRLSAFDGRPSQGRRDRRLLHGLAASVGSARGNRQSGAIAHQPVRLEQDQWRDGFALSLEA